MQAAPFFDDVAGGPDGGAAHWLTTSDDLKIRVGHWTAPGVHGTVLLFPGRTEYVEKYGRAAKSLLEHGFATVAVDWRGQGLADRMANDRGLGHVNAFTDYQRDVAAMLDHVRALGLPSPYYLIAHSMGGCIGLRALMQGLPVNAAMFSAPMWGIGMGRLLRPVAWGISTMSRQFGFDMRVAPGQDTSNYLERVAMNENELTHDPEMFAYMQAQLRAHPELGLGGPSLRWLNEALVETRQLAARPSPDVPTLTFLGMQETIVDPLRVRRRMGEWPSGQLTVLPRCKHEGMMESVDVRTRIFDATAAHFNAHP